MQEGLAKISVLGEAEWSVKSTERSMQAGGPEFNPQHSLVRVSDQLASLVLIGLEERPRLKK